MMLVGTVVHYDWQKEFEAALNGFLGATRSVPDIIRKQLGYDDQGNKEKNKWLKSLDSEETARRKKFRDEFEPGFRGFRKHPLSDQRDEAFHRSGIPQWRVQAEKLSGTYSGGPMDSLPVVETLPTITQEDPRFWQLAESPPQQIIPSAADFWWVIPQPGGPDLERPLFAECRAYLQLARDLAAPSPGRTRAAFPNGQAGHLPDRVKRPLRAHC
jgi:hypothetical protein